MRLLIQLLIIFVLSACTRNLSFENIVKYKNADVGIAFAYDAFYHENSSRPYPLMSVFKLHIATAIMDKVNRGELSLNQTIKISAQKLDTNTWTPMLKKYPQTGFEIKLCELLYYMLAESDNNACDILIEKAGGLAAIQEYVHRIGLKNTTIRVTEAQMQKDKMSQYQNTATLGDLILLLKKINNNELFAPSLHKELMDIMAQTNTGENKIKKYLPQTVYIAHKTGTSSRFQNGKKIADNDIAIIKAANKTYYLVVLITDSYETDDTNAEIIAKISQAAYEAYVNK